MIDAQNRSNHKWNRLPAFYAYFDRLKAISYLTSRFEMERIRIFLRPNGPSVYLAQANGLGTEFNTDTIGPTARQLFVLVGPTNGRAFGPNRLFGRGFLGRWPRLGKQMALWAEPIDYKFSLIFVAIKWLKANPTAVASSSALLAMTSAAIARICRDSGHFVRFMDSPLDFAAITTDTSCNTLAAPLADRASNPLDDVHQGRVIFLRSSYWRSINREKPL